MTSTLAFTEFGSAYQCLIDFFDNTINDASGGTNDESMSNAMENTILPQSCRWQKPNANNIERSIEYAIDYEVRC